MTEKRQVYTPPEGPSQVTLPSSEIYEKMGEEAIYQMLEDFYNALSQSSIAHLFHKDVVSASKKSAAFFVFILGGPPLYQQQVGPPRMRQRHLPFAIDEAARQVWLDCFMQILEDADKKYRFPPEHLEGFCQYLKTFSAWMVNTK